jgi:hypothetical protein
MAVAVWSVFRVRAVYAELERLRTASEEREQQLTQQLSQARTDRDTLRAEVDRLRQAPEAGSGLSHALIPLAPVTNRPPAGPERRITIPADTDVADFQLGLPAARKGGRYRAVLRGWSDGEEIWSQGRLDAGDGTLVVSIPARVLRAGSYELALNATSASGAREEVAFYEFVIER